MNAFGLGKTFGGAAPQFRPQENCDAPIPQATEMWHLNFTHTHNKSDTQVSLTPKIWNFSYSNQKKVARQFH